MVIKIKREQYPELAVFCCYLACLFFNYLNVLSGAVLLLGTITINIFYIHKFWKNQAIIICLCFTMTYWLYMVLYYFAEMDYCTYSVYRTLEYTNATLRVVGFFFAMLFLFIQPIKGKLSDYIPHRNNILIYLVSVLIMLFVCLYAYRVGGTFTYKTEQGVNSSLYEYYFIFALLAFVYSGNKNREHLLLVVNMLYIVLLLRLGLRLVVLMIILMLFLEYFEDRFKTKWVVVAVVAGFLFMSFWSIFRSGLVSEALDFKILLGIKKDVLITNQGDVFYTSAAQAAQVMDGEWGIAFRIFSLFSFFVNIILISKYQLVAGKLNSVLENSSIYVPGGGFGAMYAYVWLGVIGVVLLAVYIAYHINRISKSGNGDISIVYGVFLIFTFFRWYAYNLSIVFKMGFWLFLIYIAVKAFHGMIVRRNV